MRFARDSALATLLFLASAGGGCSNDARLSIDLYTDLVAGEEFDAVEVRLEGRTHSFPVSAGQSFLPAARRLGPLRAVPGAAIRIEVALVLRTRAVLTTSQTVVVRDDTVVPIYLLRSCLDVVCPSPTDVLATECRDGVCVRPDCDADAGPGVRCPPVGACAFDGDCDPPAADCARAQCLDARCVVVPSGSSCASDAYCDPDRGCVPRTMPLPDAGTPDAGPPPECVRTSDCPRETTTGWSACDYPSICSATAAPMERVVTRWSCDMSRCVSRDELESSPCARTTDGASCGGSSMGPWSACAYDPSCPRAGRRTASVTADACRAGACISEVSTVNDTNCPSLVETCNRLDDDCAGGVDDGFQVHVFDAVAAGELAARQPGCTGFGAGTDVCLTASIRWCGAHAWGCFNSALGVLDGGSRVVCLGSATEQRSLTYDDVIAASGITFGPADIGRRIATSAANRYCRANGFGGGIGPIEHSYPTFVLACVPAPLAEMVFVDPAEMTSRGCDPDADPDAAACTSAADGVCRARGYEAGWGPLEWNPTITHLLCLRG